MGIHLLFEFLDILCWCATISFASEQSIKLCHSRHVCIQFGFKLINLCLQAFLFGIEGPARLREVSINLLELIVEHHLDAIFQTAHLLMELSNLILYVSNLLLHLQVLRLKIS